MIISLTISVFTCSTSSIVRVLSTSSTLSKGGLLNKKKSYTLDYDFGWRKLPFDTIEMNTVYMYATTVTYLIFNIFKHLYAVKLNFINPKMRLKNFTLHFVTLVSKWIRKGRQWVLNIYTKKDYAPLWIT